ncbi:cysteine rich repeat protein [Rhizobium sullae]|uniref:Cysteine rich repeat protein n=2 Tax=Rhizobium sullae TaxID=50338 RepID=A0A4R3QHS7_RHISU|nr:cysteine rich repeat protein [Rhizobium sullae]
MTFTSIYRAIVIAAAILAATAASAVELSHAEQRTILSACRADYHAFCSGVRPGGGQIAACLKQHASELSKGCRKAAAARTRIEGAQTSSHSATLRTGSKVIRNIAYGGNPEQRLDVYAPANAQKAPVIFMVHGGGWARGSKSASRVVDAKVAYWLPRGYIFISVDTRLLPSADPLDQAGDVAVALAYAQKHAASWGGDPSRFVLMGHSAGAHLVMLLTADPDIAGSRGAASWRATIALDSAAYDVSAIMKKRHPALYDRAFGADPIFWHKASPTLRLKTRPVSTLLVCSSRRADSCPAAKEFASRAQTLGSRSEVFPIDLSHAEINSELGENKRYTTIVDAFLRSVL